MSHYFVNKFLNTLKLNLLTYAVNKVPVLVIYHAVFIEDIENFKYIFFGQLYIIKPKQFMSIWHLLNKQQPMHN